MSKNTKRNLRLGGFVLGGLIFFVTGIYLLGKQRNLFGQTFRLSGIFHDVNGLQVGNNVRFSGINIGTIEDIQIISDTTVRVDMIIEAEVRKYIKKDAVATIGSEGLMGNKVITISPGSPQNQVINNNDIIKTAKPIDFDEILGSVKKTTQNAENITTNLSEIIGKINNGQGTLGMLLNDSGVAKNVEQTLVNIKEGSKGFSENMEAVQGNWLLRRHFRNKDKTKESEVEKNKEKKTTRNKNDKQEKKGLFKKKTKSEGNQ